MHNEIVKLLENHPIFSSLNPSDKVVVISLSEQMELKDEHAVFHAGQASTQFFIVLEGKISIRRGEHSNEQIEIARFLSGDCFGELEFFTADPRTASAITVGPTRLLAFPNHANNLSDFSTKWPSESAHLFHSFLVHISSRIRHANTMVKENTPLVRGLRQQAYVDKLTGLHNKTYFEESLQKEVKESDKFGLLVFKPDNFKQINDAHGHEAGDNVLRFMAETLRQIVPNPDMLFRYTGNENTIILSGADHDALKACADTIGDCLRTLDISPVIGESPFRLSVSFGLVLFPDNGNTAEDLVKTAHKLVMEGRERGGNFILFPEDSNTTL